MPEYDLRYRRSDGVLVLQFVVQTGDDAAAAVIGHENWTSRYATLEIWRGTECVSRARNPNR